MITIYDNPELYEIVLQQEDKEIEEETEFINSLFRKYIKTNNPKLLDVACGPCEHSLQLAKKGYQVTGLDVSEKMLAYAERKANNRGVKLNLKLGNMRSFSLGETFDVAICTYESILHLLSNNDYYTHFNSVANHLCNNGLYYVVLDMANKWLPSFLSLPTEFKEYSSKRFVWGEKNIRARMFSSNVDFVTGIYEWGIKCEIYTDKSLTFLESEIESKNALRVLMTQEFLALVEASQKFELVSLFGDYKYSPLNSSSDKRIVVLRKKNNK